MWFLTVSKHITLLFETLGNKYAFCNTVMTYVCARTRYIYIATVAKRLNVIAFIVSTNKARSSVNEY